MSKDSRSDDKPDPPGHPPAGPTDHGGKGGMATRELAPDISEPDGTDKSG